MELLEGIETRRSIRTFTPAPISKEVLENILKASTRSPSYTNTQPWEAAVITGDKKDKLSKILCDLAEADTTPASELPTPTTWPPELERRSREHGKKRFLAVGIERENQQQRKEMRLLNFKFYGAPCVLFLFMDSTLGPWSVFDMGLFAQTVCLAAHSFGVESCLQASLAGYPDAVRRFLGLPETKKLVLGISMGYPDLEAPLNSYHSTRVGLSEFVKWYS